ncbi:hypothetical protein EDF81_0490 [Enterobacter sp. BIGb0383]|uniref:hypothetical protein n=1 Tax=unclassified Enterobacter TaxID=2608935 RepID=UPI000F47294D|nr:MULTISPECIES: hypothetical protein [unclassified Enterobacter]ROP62011.1 hypothetical protein EDF81_0490 [Enterobacter sp. BIGb0383]ROS12172.1 hypothetical protein EC848_0491 [Enterobacter sp. BIGb0359]
MVRTTDKSEQNGKQTSQPASAEYEAMLGRIVIEMLRAGRPVSRQSLCAKIAFLLSESPQPSQELLYENLLRMLLNVDRTDR